jgi:hypothetical protein
VWIVCNFQSKSWSIILGCNWWQFCVRLWILYSNKKPSLWDVFGIGYFFKNFHTHSGTGVHKVMYLVLPQLICFNWYVLQYQYSYQYHIPRLHPTHQYNTGTSRQYIYTALCVCVCVCVYYHNPAIQLLLHNFPTKSLTRAGKQLPFKTQSKLHLTLHQKLSIVSMYPVFQRRGKFSFCLIITARFRCFEKRV